MKLLSGSEGLLFEDRVKFLVSCDQVTGLVAGLFCSRGLGEWVNLSPCWNGRGVPTPPGRPGLGLIQSPCPPVAADFK